MLVKDVMGCSVKTVRPETQLIEVVSLMCLYRFSGLPVVDDNMKLLGFVAEKDVLARMFPSLQDLMEGGMAAVDMDDMMNKYQDVVKLKVSDIMTKGAMSVSPDMHVLRAAAVMARNKFRRIPVAVDGRLVGMVSMGDVHKAIFQANVTKAAGG